MKKILLINPPTPEFTINKEFIIPPSLVYLANHLISTHTAMVDILDCNTDEFIISPKYDYIGITNLFSGHFKFCRELSKKIKEHGYKIKIIVGGIHPTIFAHDIIKNCNHIDYVVIGEGEDTLRKIISDDNNISGVCYRENNNIIYKRKLNFINDTNMISPPIFGYNCLDLEKYKYDRSHWYNPKKFDLSNCIEAPIFTSRSCPNRCNFCSMWLVMGPKIRLRNPYLVVNEIEWFYKEHGVRMFSMLDDNITLVKHHIKGICNEIIKRKLDISWQPPNGLMTRTLDYDIIDLMVESGWYRTMLAIESGNDFIRNQIMGKKLPRETIYKVVEYIKNKYPHVYIRGLYIMGMPEDTNESLQDSYNLINDLPLNTNSIANIMPFPGTAIFDQCVRDSLFIDSIDIKNLWQEERMDYNGNKKFYIKPYKMDISELKDWRNKFDNLI